MVNIFYAQFRKCRPRLQLIGWQSLQSGQILPVGRNPNGDGSWALNLLCNGDDASIEEPINFSYAHFEFKPTQNAS